MGICRQGNADRQHQVKHQVKHQGKLQTKKERDLSRSLMVSFAFRQCGHAFQNNQYYQAQKQ
jgi:hypothetical protein